MGDKTGHKSDPEPRIPIRPGDRFVETTPERTSATKKRGRDRPKAKLDSDDESAEEEEDTRSRKKGRKSNGATRKVTPSPESSSDRACTIVEFLEPSKIKKWRDRSSWEQYIEMIEAIQREVDGDIFIFFTLHVCRLFAGTLSDSLRKLFAGRVRRRHAEKILASVCQSSI